MDEMADGHLDLNGRRPFGAGSNGGVGHFRPVYKPAILWAYFIPQWKGKRNESLQLRIDVSLDQDKDENQDQEIVYSQSAENSDMDVVTLESDCPPSSSSSSSSSDGTMSGPELVEIISPNTPPKVFKSASKRFIICREMLPYHQLSLLTRVRQSLSLLHNPQMGQTKLQEKD